MPCANLCNSRNTNHRGSLAVNARITDFREWCCGLSFNELTGIGVKFIKLFQFSPPRSSAARLTLTAQRARKYRDRPTGRGNGKTLMMHGHAATDYFLFRFGLFIFRQFHAPAFQICFFDRFVRPLTFWMGARADRVPHESSPLVPDAASSSLAFFQPLGVILPVNDWATILPSRTTNVSVAISYTLSAVSAVHRM